MDLGASSGRVAVGTVTNGVLDFEVVHRFANEPVETPEGLKWNFQELIRQIEIGITKAGESGAVASIGVDTWAVDYGILDSEDRIVCEPFHYRNGRTDGLMQSLSVERKAMIFSETGIQFLPFNTIYQLVAHKRDRPGDLRSGNQLLMMPDLIHWSLTGKRSLEKTNASSTQMLNPRTGTWSKAILEFVGLDENLFPELVEPGSVLGFLKPELRNRKGLANAQVIAPATHDTASAVLAVPLSDSRTSAYISSGTWSLLGAELSEPLIDESAAKSNFSNEGGACGTVRFLKNMMGLWIFQECCRAWKVEDVGSLVEDAAKHLSGASVFDPDDSTFLHPGLDMPERVLRAIGQSDLPKEKISASIFVSLARKSATLISDLKRITSRKIDEICVVGGGSQNDLLNQAIANCCGIRVVAGPVEATLMGNLLMQFDSQGELGGHDIRQVVRNSSKLRVFEPKA